MGRYIYCIIHRQPITDNRQPIFGPIGINGAEVYTVSALDIACLVSNSQFFNYRSMPKSDVATHLSIYQSVIEQVMKDYTVIPVKFGMIAEDEDKVRKILLTGYQEIREALNKMENKIEFDVISLWSDFDSVLKEIGEEKEIEELKIKTEDRERETTFEDRIKIGQAVKFLLDKRRDKILGLIQNALEEIAVDSSNHECLDDKMIMNTAFLIERDKEVQFDKLINEIDKKLQGKVHFRCVGPLPPYSFSQVEVKRIRKDDLKKGMAILGLERDVGAIHELPLPSQVKNAYRTLARKYHPDMLPQNAGVKANERFNELTQAYELLLDYSQGIEKGKVSKNSIVIKL